MMAKSAEPVTIKRYANCRLYHTGTGTYVTVEEIAALVEDDQDVIVHDARTGENITRFILARQCLQ